ncbi:hypothetical protein CO667_00420 [Rhizobium sp. L43]|nr:hypothetical protein CO667_00420 [Rhizobium sp. L43]
MYQGFECACSPLIRPFGPPSPRGEKGTEASRHIPFSPAGRRWRQPDEGASISELSNHYFFDKNFCCALVR